MKRVFAIVMFASMLIPAVFAQTQSKLRTRYGPPDSKGRYTVRPGVGLEAIFALDGQSASMTVKPFRSSDGASSKSQKPAVINTVTASEILDEVVPVSERGKQTDSFVHERSC